MRAVLQRVTEASVTVNGTLVGRIGRGLVVLVGVARGDGPGDAEYIANKVRDLRVFEDEGGRMNRSVGEVAGSLLLVSQFTLLADARKGRRPSFDAAAPPEVARALFDEVVRRCRESGLAVETGTFQAAMQVRLVNDGPVTVLLDSSRVL